MSLGAGRMSLSSNCSLIINNITAEDAGRYTGRLGHVNYQDILVYLHMLTIVPFPPDADPRSGGNISLQCSLIKYNTDIPCKENSIIWVDETGTVLLGEGDGFVSGGQNNCVSDLMVKHQRGSKRRFTCQVVEGDRVKIDAEYTLDFTDVSEQHQQEGAGYETLRNATDKSGRDVFMINLNDDPDKNVTYTTVDHSNAQNVLEMKVKEEEDVVIYSNVRTEMKAEADDTPNGPYSCVS
ncbi:uncharacterized protein LOC133418454 [Cololabis saira]|uniref:uncharacterized protein LOC133418454 n=1 Tax=Cololabis saira TaxID=129043 RepID=UPI002AD2650A|nr:uncharacterized protein LOC133418454 [Cololabis saira]